MPYVKMGYGAGAGLPFQGLGEHRRPFGTTAEQAAELARQRAAETTRVPTLAWEGVLGVLSVARRVCQALPASDPAVAREFGAACRQVVADVQTINSDLATPGSREYGPGYVVVHPKTWARMREVAAQARPLLERMRAATEPMRLVVRNGQSVEDAERVGIFEPAYRR